MTDNEIIKALERCISERTCDTNCPMWSVQHCGYELRKEALDLINRQKAEIERLKKGWKADVIETSNIKAEAVKEVLEKLKEKAFIMEIPFEANADKYLKLVAVEEIDNFLKEMAGAGNGNEKG